MASRTVSFIVWLILAQAVSVVFTDKLHAHAQVSSLAPDTTAPLMRQVTAEREEAVTVRHEQQDAGAEANEESRYHTIAHALKGGLAGMVAGAFQVLCLMWLRTANSHQSYHGGSLSQTFGTLWAAGGVPRFYQGLSFALLQVPAARFGDAFAESVTLAMFGAHGQQVPGFLTSMVVATIGSAWRLLISPLDALKTTAQVHGVDAKRALQLRTQHRGTADLWSGASASFVIIWVSSYPWWAVYNTVFEYWSEPSDATMKIVHNGVAGMLASMASDVTSNSLRVLKIMRAANTDADKGTLDHVGYLADAKGVLARDGVPGLLFRGLPARMLTGMCQGAFFSIFWNLLLGPATGNPSAAILESENQKMEGSSNITGKAFGTPSSLGFELFKNASNVTRDATLMEVHPRSLELHSSSGSTGKEGRQAVRLPGLEDAIKALSVQEFGG